MSNKLYYSCISKMKKYGLLDEIWTQEGKRSSKLYQLSEGLELLLASITLNTPCDHRELITEVLTGLNAHGDGSSGMVNPNIKAQHRTLLIYLLYKADLGGAARGVAQNQIYRNTGVSSEQLRNITNTLYQEELLHRYVPGMTGKRLYGRSPGTYFLNLSTPCFSSRYSRVIVFVGESNHDKLKSYGSECLSLLQASKFEVKGTPTEKNEAYIEYYHPGKLVLSSRFNEIRMAFGRTDNKLLGGYLQLKLYEYASAILNEYRIELEKSLPLPEPFLERLVQDIFSKSLLELYGEVRARDVASFFIEFSVMIARRIVDALEYDLTPRHEKRHLVILPPRSYSLNIGLAVIATSKSEIRIDNSFRKLLKKPDGSYELIAKPLNELAEVEKHYLGLTFKTQKQRL